MAFSNRVQALSRLDLRFPVLLSIALFCASPAAAQTPAVQSAPPAAAADALSEAFAAATKKAEPAVVSIDTRSRVVESARRGGGTAPEGADDILDFLGRQFPPRPQAAVGSGFIVDKEGYIVTNWHVVEDADRITVKLDSGEEFPGKLIGQDQLTDIAVLKIDAGRELPFVKFGDSDKARVGEWVLALGSPFGLNRTVTAGIVSQVQRETENSSPFQRFIQTDAAINRGNSGGPLINLAGEVIGVNSQIATITGNNSGIGFALPSATASRVYSQIKADGKVRRGFLGLSLDTVRDEYAKVYGLGDERGAIVTGYPVADTPSPARDAGVLPGDVIVAFNGTRVADTPDLIAKVSAVSPDSPANITLLREVNGKIERKTLPIALAERPGDARADANTPRKLPLEDRTEADKPFGLTIEEVTADIAAALKLTGPKGVVVRAINPESYIAEVKLATGAEALGRGDIIQRVNRQTVANKAEFLAIAAKLKKGDPVVMHVLTPQPGRDPARLKVVQFTVQ
ncbi:MAG: trypsin-like peptidase domain-containing protein [Pyrinomonadaceae bacterium]|nr:trypsin-like peptidase domain-containing protein [Pyrinomonadaceae bacterium]